MVRRDEGDVTVYVFLIKYDYERTKKLIENKDIDFLILYKIQKHRKIFCFVENI